MDRYTDRQIDSSRVSICETCNDMNIFTLVTEIEQIEREREKERAREIEIRQTDRQTDRHVPLW